MDIYLPIAEMTVSIEMVLALGVIVGFLSGVFGLGGGFLTTPFLIFMGVPSAVAVGTQSSQLIASGTSGVLGHWKKGNVDMLMAGIMLIGSLIGTLIGIVAFRFLENIGQIDFVIPIIYMMLLTTMGFIMLIESVTTLLRSKFPGLGMGKSDEKLHDHPIFKSLPYKMRFPRSRLYVSVFIPGGIGFVGGLLVSMLGISGGFLLVPAMIYILGMPTLLVAGTSLFRILVTAVFTTLMHAVANHSIDLVLAVLLILGSVIGTQIGLRAARFIKGAIARMILAFLFFFVSIRLAGEVFIPPVDIYTTIMN